jgi:hypothetical protein
MFDHLSAPAAAPSPGIVSMLKAQSPPTVESLQNQLAQLELFHQKEQELIEQIKARYILSPGEPAVKLIASFDY